MDPWLATIDEMFASHAGRIFPESGDDRAPIGTRDQNGRTRLGTQHLPHPRHVTRERGQIKLNGSHAVACLLESLNDGTPAGAVRPALVNQHYVGYTHAFPAFASSCIDFGTLENVLVVCQHVCSHKEMKSEEASGVDFPFPKPSSISVDPHGAYPTPVSILVKLWGVTVH